MQVSAEDDWHPKQKGRRDLQLAFININNYRKEVNTCDVLCVILRTHLQCNSSMLVKQSLKSYPLLLGDSTTTPILVVPALYLAHTAKRKPTPLHTVEVLPGT